MRRAPQISRQRFEFLRGQVRALITPNLLGFVSHSKRPCSNQECQREPRRVEDRHARVLTHPGLPLREQVRRMLATKDFIAASHVSERESAVHEYLPQIPLLRLPLPSFVLKSSFEASLVSGNGIASVIFKLPACSYPFWERRMGEIIVSPGIISRRRCGGREFSGTSQSRFSRLVHRAILNSHGVMDTGKSFLAFAAFLAGLYLLLAQSLAILEVVAAAGCGVLGTLALRALLNSEPIRFSFSLRWSSAVVLLPPRVLRDSLLVFAALPGFLIHRRDHLGMFQEKSFGDSPEEAARRALSVLETSMPPNTYVVDVSDLEDRQITHHLVSTQSIAHARSG